MSETLESEKINSIGITCKDVENCAFSNWYPKFKSHTFKSRIYNLSNEFVEYLNAGDGIYLVEDGQPKAANIEEIDSDTEETVFSESEHSQKTPNFPEVEQFIRETIVEYEGAVFPKLNWTSPRDAAWISATQSLKCTSPFDVFLLLKSSDFIYHDLNHAYEHCVDKDEHEEHQQQFTLVLRKWYDLQPSMEFRCFVKNREIIGITQRDTYFYPFLLDMKQDIEQLIYQFFEDTIREEFECNHYTFDIYVERKKDKVYLVDFNPFSPATDSLLYHWNELMTFDIEKETPDIRIIESQAESDSLACNAPKFATNMIPKDVIDLSSGKSIAEFAEEFEKAMRKAESGECSSDSEADEE
ncbi:cell division cycle 123 [Mycotypha africana]|uniref:cell division cycle 123 n=1 Tax=Mycotypha africana TaxID=64632 RepID=UPI002301A234|nr:cell division cycle 123 [Mycotypha africana]KAI8970149.1 cell division cycle 123 [Mycotypha africana]